MASNVVGRKSELALIRACIQAGRNILLEGPVGVGKTYLALQVAETLNRPIFRIDGDARYTEQKLTGWFDPPTVLKKGYIEEAFIAGPLVEAMRSGGILFINELNRLPEGVQNVLLPAIDERTLQLPKMEEIRAAPGFLVLATQNPKEFVATSSLSEALLDRFELLVLDYPTEDQEVAIVRANGKFDENSGIPKAAVRLARLTREDPKVRRGASIRAALSVSEVANILVKTQGFPLAQAMEEAAIVALPTRIEVESEVSDHRKVREELERKIRAWVKEALTPPDGAEKKSP